MRRLLYISPDSFIDVDFPVVRKLNEVYHLFWQIIYPGTGPNKFSTEEIDDFCRQHGINYSITFAECRARDPRRILIDLGILRSAKKFNPDIIYIETFPDPYLPWLTRAYFPSSRIVIAIHDATPHTNQVKLARQIIEKFSLSLFSNYQLFSATQEKLFLQAHPDKKTFVAPLCLKDFGPPRSSIKKRDKVTFLFFGTIYYYKGLDILIEAVNILSERTSDFTILVAGNCADFDRYRSLIRNPERFSMEINMIPNNEIADIFNRADYLILPYRDVTQSGPLLIAYNYNVPVIASDLDGFLEYIRNGETGYLFPAGDAEALATLLFKIISQTNDENHRIRENLSAYITENINLDTIIEKYVRFFDSIR